MRLTKKSGQGERGSVRQGCLVVSSRTHRDWECRGRVIGVGGKKGREQFHRAYVPEDGKLKGAPKEKGGAVILRKRVTRREKRKTM